MWAECSWLLDERFNKAANFRLYRWQKFTQRSAFLIQKYSVLYGRQKVQKFSRSGRRYFFCKDHCSLVFIIFLLLDIFIFFKVSSTCWQQWMQILDISTKIMCLFSDPDSFFFWFSFAALCSYVRELSFHFSDSFVFVRKRLIARVICRRTFLPAYETANGKRPLRFSSTWMGITRHLSDVLFTI